MLIQKPVSVGDVIVFRISSGEEIVGKLHSTHGDTILVTRPVILGVQMVDENQARLGFAPFMAGADEDTPMPFNVPNLTVRPMRPRKDVANSYIAATTQLEIPKSGLLLP